MRMKMHVLVRVSYGDFDCRYEDPKFCSTDKDLLKSKVDELRAARTPKEIEDGVDYEILPDTIKVL